MPVWLEQALCRSGFGVNPLIRTSRYNSISRLPNFTNLSGTLVALLFSSVSPLLSLSYDYNTHLLFL